MEMLAISDLISRNGEIEELTLTSVEFWFTHVCYRACTSITCEAFRFVYYNKHNSENADYLINNVMRV